MERRAFTAPTGGVMTDEVGAITGDLEVWLDDADSAKAQVSYVGALDAYTVSGSAADLSVDQVVAKLSADPGSDETGNPACTQL